MRGRAVESTLPAAIALRPRSRMPSVEKRQRLQGLIARITLNPEGLEIGTRTAHLADILRRGEETGTREPMALPDLWLVKISYTAETLANGSSAG